MRFDQFIQVLLPHDEKFYALFEESTRTLGKATELLKTLPTSSGSQRSELVNRIQDLEHEGDEIAHKIFAELNATFVTPFDREDIHVLTSALDDILDYIQGSANRFEMYKLDQCPPDMVKLIEILHLAVEELKTGVGHLRDLRKSDQLQTILRKINEYENEADAVFETAIANLFEFEKDPIKIIKLKEIYVGLETATDKCEDAANVLEAILIKYG